VTRYTGRITTKKKAGVRPKKTRKSRAPVEALNVYKIREDWEKGG